MKFTTVSTILAFLAAAQACAIKGCSGENGEGTCTELKDQQDGGCHSIGDRLFLSYIWSGDDCPDSSKVLCGWESGACNGPNAAIRDVANVPRAQMLNPEDGLRTFRSFKFMNSDFC